MSAECLKFILESDPEKLTSISWKTDGKVNYAWWNSVCSLCHSAIALEKSKDPKLASQIKISPVNNLCPQK